jgi:uncharacterized oxidoreductase
VLVTGGASGIGLALAERFLQAGNEVIICGRRADKLKEARTRHPGLHTYEVDLSRPESRQNLIERLIKDHTSLDVLVNNAGIQQRIDLNGDPSWNHVYQELAINLEAPIHLSMLLIPHLRKQTKPAIINVSSGLAFVPLAATPVYSATKAAMHSFTQSLRRQLRDTDIRVIELIPPAVDTDLGGPGLHTWGVPLDEFADVAFAALKGDDDREISHQFSSQSSQASRQELDAIFTSMNK